LEEAHSSVIAALERTTLQPSDIRRAMLDLSDFLRLHAVKSAEIFSGISDQRSVARMIDRFDTGNGFHLAWFVLVNVLDQLGLGVRRAGDAGRCQGWLGD